MSEKPPLERYLELEQQLKAVREKWDREEDPILDEMDTVWRQLSPEEETKLNRMSPVCWPGEPVIGRFLTKEEGGRETPFTGRVYRPTMRIDGREFSVVLHAAAIQYLVRDQPDLPELKPGTPIRLYEGGALVFEGVIV